MATEKEKMLTGDIYSAADPQLITERKRARELCKALNNSNDDEQDLRANLIQQLFSGDTSQVWIEPPFYCDYGTNITVGKMVFFNYNCVILDSARVTIGNNVLFGPNVQLYTATHPLNAAERAGSFGFAGFALPIEIGNDVWIGGGTVICSGVAIGARTVIGAGSVVTKSIPDDVLAVGNPCRVIRPLND